MIANRRDFLAMMAATASLGSHAAHARDGVLRKIGLQLYTVRDLLTADFEGTLTKVAQLGYREVEFAGILGPDIKRTRELLDRLDLAAPSLHSDYQTLRKNPAIAFDAAIALGASFVVCPWLDPPDRQTVDDLKRVCENLNAIGERAQGSALTLAYHNHAFEFADLADGITPFDLLLSRTDERHVKFELDVYWARKGGADPAAFLGAHQSRFYLVHLKDMAGDGSFTEVGNGTINFGEVIAALSAGRVRHAFVEQDVSPDPMQSIKTSFAYLRRLR
jgi:sugar phosphate isomerase/epimerase